MSITKKDFGKAKCGCPASLYTIENKKGAKAVVSDFGALLVELWMPDKDGKLDDIVLGYDSIEPYYACPAHFGATIGRNGNRICNAKFSINGVEYKLAANENENSLHSCPDGYHYRMWTAEEIGEDSVRFSLESKDGDQGFPGNFKVSVTYTLTDDNEVVLTYDGISDADTIANMTNHSYFNLAGHASGKSIVDNILRLDTDKYTPVVDNKAIPNGEIASVEGTPFDFRTPTRIGNRIDADDTQIQYGGGYDHNYVFKSAKSADMVSVGEVYEPETGRTMEVSTDCVCCQLYCGNFIHTCEAPGKGGVKYGKRSALCLETQFAPNAINEPNFISPILKAGEKYHTVTVYKFGIK